MINKCNKLERLNISNNKINSESFRRLASEVSNSTSLKLLEIRYNNISSMDV